jgi:hypothetical protein
MNFENMNEMITDLLDRKVIELLTIENSGDFEWFDDTQEQYCIIEYDMMITYCDCDGIITDLEGFSKDSDNTWFGHTFKNEQHELETVVNPNNCDDTVLNDDGSLKCPVYSNVCDLNLWNKVL